MAGLLSKYNSMQQKQQQRGMYEYYVRMNVRILTTNFGHDDGAFLSCSQRPEIESDYLDWDGAPFMKIYMSQLFLKSIFIVT